MGNARVLGQFRAGIQTEDQSPGEAEHGDGAASSTHIVMELGAHHSVGLQPQPVPVKDKRSLQVLDGERDGVDAGLHLVPPHG